MDDITEILSKVALITITPLTHSVKGTLWYNHECLLYDSMIKKQRFCSLLSI
jgi:hypothetical protein